MRGLPFQHKCEIDMCIQTVQSKCGSRGGGGQGVRTPPGKSQVILVSIVILLTGQLKSDNKLRCSTDPEPYIEFEQLGLHA